MKQVLQSLKPLAFPCIRSEPPRIQRARPKSSFVRASFDPTARALIRAGPFFLVGFGWIWLDLVGFGWIWSDLVGFGWIWSDLVGFDAIPRIRCDSFFIISPIPHFLVAARSARICMVS